MPGELSTSELLRTLKVTTHPSIFVFLTVPSGTECPIPINSVQMTFREREGLTLIVPQHVAKSYGFSDEQYTFPSKMITCDVHSSLDAVGFMAVISNALAAAQISTNPVSGYYHDHLFVPVEMADAAVAVMERLVSTT